MAQIRFNDYHNRCWSEDIITDIIKYFLLLCTLILSFFNYFNTSSITYQSKWSTDDNSISHVNTATKSHNNSFFFRFSSYKNHFLSNRSHLFNIQPVTMWFQQNGISFRQLPRRKKATGIYIKLYSPGNLLIA